MEYIIHRRFKTKAICGDVNLPSGTVCHEKSGMLFYDCKPLCMATSENAHQYFARNDDGNGMERGQLIWEIKNRLNKQDGEYQKRWDKVWADSLCQKYKRTEHTDHWLWNHAFYNADLADLKSIASLIGLKV